MEPVTIKDIAKALKLSTSTVSRALRDSYEINAETKRMVQEYATKLNYRPNPIAQGLKENRSRAIGVIVPEIANNFFSEAITGIEDVASDRLALACFEVLSRRGIRCPEDLALIGFTNLKVAHLLSPALTTVTQPAFEIGQAAVELLIDLIEKKKRQMGGSYLIKLPTELVVRASSV